MNSTQAITAITGGIREEQSEIVSIVDTFLHGDRKLLVLEADAGVGKTIGVSVPSVLYTKHIEAVGNRILYVTNSKRNRHQVQREFERISQVFDHVKPLEIHSRYDYIAIDIFIEWVHRDKEITVAARNGLDAAIRNEYGDRKVVHQSEFREIVLATEESYRDRDIPWIDFAVTPEQNPITKEQIDNSNVEIITHAMLVFNSYIQRKIKKGNYTVIIIDEMDQLLPACEGKNKVRVNLSDLMEDLKALRLNGITKALYETSKVFIDVLATRTSVTFNSDNGFTKSIRETIIDDLENLYAMWEEEIPTIEKEFPNFIPRINKVQRKWDRLADWLDFTPEDQRNRHLQAQQYVSLDKGSLILEIPSINPGSDLVWLWRIDTKMIAMSACMGIPNPTENVSFIKRYGELSRRLAMGKDIDNNGTMEFHGIPSKYKKNGNGWVGHGIAQFMFSSTVIHSEERFVDGILSQKYVDELRRTVQICRAQHPDENIVILSPAFKDLIAIRNGGDYGINPTNHFLQQPGTDVNALVDQFMQASQPSILYTVRWEGLDIPEKVHNLVITRLPFVPPASGVHKANMEDHEKHGEYKSHYEFGTNKQNMVRRTNQGLGRGIRTPMDFCRYWIIDSRMPKPRGDNRGKVYYQHIYPDRFRRPDYHGGLYKILCKQIGKPIGRSMEDY